MKNHSGSKLQKKEKLLDAYKTYEKNNLTATSREDFCD